MEPCYILCCSLLISVSRGLSTHQRPYALFSVDLAMIKFKAALDLGYEHQSLCAKVSLALLSAIGADIMQLRILASYDEMEPDTLKIVIALTTNKEEE